MKPTFDVRRLAREAADNCIKTVLLAPPYLREKVAADLLKSFVDVCASHGVEVTPDDIGYFAKLVTDRFKAANPDSGSTLH